LKLTIKDWKNDVRKYFPEMTNPGRILNYILEYGIGFFMKKTL